MKAILDHWVGNRTEDTEHTIASTGELLALLKRLGTNHHTLLSQYHPSKDPDNNHLMIGGGPQRYVLTGCEEGTILNVRNPQMSDTATVKILVGGQLSLFTEHELVTQEQAFECAVQYFKTGCISHVGLPYTWERL